MIVLGITGGSGCGKTTVSKIFEENGINIIDGDIVARKIAEPGMPALSEIEDAFGSDYINPDKTLNRKKLGGFVFSNPDKLLILNSITHKYISQYIDSYIKDYKKDIVGIDAAALIESNIYKKCDYIVSVLSDYDLRIDRIMKRDNITYNEAKTRIDAQKSDQFYIENSDYIVYNNGSYEDLLSQIKKIIDYIRSKMWKK